MRTMSELVLIFVYLVVSVLAGLVLGWMIAHAPKE